ncbi:MAG: redox-regulated ATPase YchF [Waddliaceae bacterium]
MSGLSSGIIGLPNVGKSTLFNALTANVVDASNYPFCTIEPNVGVVEVIDPRLQVLSDLSHSRKIIYPVLKFFDIAGLVKGASKGEGLGNQFLAHIRETDAIVHVVRCFESSDVVHVTGKIDPIEDIEVINLELALADLQSAEKALARVEKQAKGSKEKLAELNCLRRVRDHLDQSQPIRTLSLTEEEERLLNPYPFLTAKKVLYAANVAESDLPAMDNDFVTKVREYAEAEGNLVIPFCAQLEEEIAQLPKEEQQEFLASAGLEESGLQRLVHAAFDLLHLITFITTGEPETRAWTITKGTTAVEAAGKIHTDIQKGFVRAEVVAYEDMVAYQGRVAAREHGKARSEGKEYIVKDGDVILFMHH